MRLSSSQRVIVTLDLRNLNAFQPLAKSDLFHIRADLGYDVWRFIPSRQSFACVMARFPETVEFAASAEASTREDERFSEQLLIDFGEAHAQGAAPRIEDYLQAIPPGANSEALTQFLEIEVGARLDAEQSVDPSDYSARFPEHAAEIAAAIDRIKRRRAASTGAYMHLRPGMKIGQFQLGSELGRGGVAVVYRANDNQLNRSLAFKTLLPEKLAQRSDESERSHQTRVRGAVQRLRREAELTAALSHPGVPPVHAVGELPDGRPYFCMRLVQGETFARALSRDPDDRVKHLQILEQVADTLSSAHEASIIHRDLKPGNVMVGRYGEVQLMDWGMAKRLVASDEADPNSGEPHNQSDSTVSLSTADSESFGISLSAILAGTSIDLGADATLPGAVMGTLAYMPPEQAQGRTAEHDCRTDVFALGAILCQILTGFPPYSGERRDEVWRQAQRADLGETFKRLDSGSFDPQLVELARDCLAVQLEQRPANAGEVAARLREYSHSVEQRLRSAEIETAQAEARANEQRKRADVETSRRRTVVALLGTVVALVLVALGGAAAVRMQQVRSASVVENERLLNDIERAESLAESLMNAPPAAVPYALESLAPLQQHATPHLRTAISDERRTVPQRLHAGLGLAQFEKPPSEFLVASVAAAHPEECTNIVQALARDRTAALEAIAQVTAETESSAAADALRKRARLAVVALHLGEPESFQAMAALRADPTQRTALIDELAAWHGDLSSLRDVAGVQFDAAGLSALCAGVSQIEFHDKSETEAEDWIEFLQSTFLNSKDASVHSAAARGLRAWNVELPAIHPPREPARRWQENSVGMSLVRVDAGSFERSTDAATDGQMQTVLLTRPFWIAAEETSIEQYLACVHDDDLAEAAKPQRPAIATQVESSTPEFPVRGVSWEDAAKYCNWLSEREGLLPCYLLSGSHWVWNQDANGYRLPTEAEWEFAARGGTTSLYGHGDDHDLLRKYAVFSTSRPSPCGSRLPNALGLFDMHGNVHEWCFDYYQGEYPTGEEIADPVVETGRRNRVSRGGSYYDGTHFLQSATRKSAEPSLRSERLGFRVVRIAPR